MNVDPVDIVRTTLELVAAGRGGAAQFGALVTAVRELSGCPNVALRLRHDEGRWIPFVAHRGLTSRFLRDETILRNVDCLCGRVCRGDVDSSLEIFTPNGSFFCGRSQDVPERFTSQELGPVRGRCLVEGFETIALVPVRAHGEIVGMLYMSSPEPDAMSPEALELLESFCNEVGSALLGNTPEERERETARLLRDALAPQLGPRVGALEVAATARPAGVGTPLGGDFCDALELPDGRSCLFVGDISGEGIEVAGLAAHCRWVVADLAHLASDAAELMAMANASLSHDLPEDRFATLATAYYSPEDRSLAVALAGHPRPVLLGDGNGDREVGEVGPPLGVVPDERYPLSTVSLEETNVVFIYTDGITDAPGPHGRFGEEGLEAALALARGLGTSELAAHVCAAAAEFAGNRHTDDMLALAARPVAD
jgi:serine phosphatase RsbU (regulator of sigma subunit)